MNMSHYTQLTPVDDVEEGQRFCVWSPSYRRFVTLKKASNGPGAGYTKCNCIWDEGTTMDGTWAVIHGDV